MHITFFLFYNYVNNNNFLYIYIFIPVSPASDKEPPAILVRTHHACSYLLKSLLEELSQHIRVKYGQFNPCFNNIFFFFFFFFFFSVRTKGEGKGAGEGEGEREGREREGEGEREGREGKGRGTWWREK